MNHSLLLESFRSTEDTVKYNIILYNIIDKLRRIYHQLYKGSLAWTLITLNWGWGAWYTIGAWYAIGGWYATGGLLAGENLVVMPHLKHLISRACPQSGKLQVWPHPWQNPCVIRTLHVKAVLRPHLAQFTLVVEACGTNFNVMWQPEQRPENSAIL